MGRGGLDGCGEISGSTGNENGRSDGWPCQQRHQPHSGVLLTRAELHQIEEPADTGGEPGAPRVPHLGYASDIVELVEEYLYRPLARR